VRPVDENALLRDSLASLLARAFQRLTPDLSDGDLNAVACAGDPVMASIFELENVSKQRETRAVRVKIISPLFTSDAFPFEITYDDPLNMTIAKKLPS
jgi:precorrin-2 methylase